MIICNNCYKEKEGVQTGVCNHCGKFGKTNRELAMNWWNNLISARKTEICDINTWLVGSIRRHETLTGNEIEQLFNKEYSLYWENCYNKNCIYNVSLVCKCKDVGSTCQSYIK